MNVSLQCRRSAHWDSVLYVRTNPDSYRYDDHFPDHPDDGSHSTWYDILENEMSIVH